MKIAFIILAYKNPYQLKCLVESLVHPEHYFFIHIDGSKNIKPFQKELDAIKNANMIFLDRKNSYWGSYQCVKVVLNGLKVALNHTESFDYFIHLSGQDFPVKPVSQIRETLAKNIPTSYLYHFTLPAKNWNNGGMDRLENCQFFIGGKRFVITGRSSNPLYKVFYFFWKRFVKKFDSDKQYYGGEFYFIFHRAAVETLFSNCEKYKALSKRLKYTQIPEEMFIPTMLLTDESKRNDLKIENETLRYINWDVKSNSPKTLTESDVQYFKQGAFLFARKFDFEITPGIIRQLQSLITENNPSEF